MGQLKFLDTQEGTAWVNALSLEMFIETGTEDGGTLANAAEVFSACHSIEIDHNVYLKASRRFLHNKNVKVYHGNSPDVLPWLIDPTKPTLFWLDAHYDAGSVEVPNKYGQCPLLAELGVIASFDWKAPAYIMIDDAHCFSDLFWDLPGMIYTTPYGNQIPDVVKIGKKGWRRSGCRREEWPSLEQIKVVLPNHIFSLREYEDIIMGTPK